MDLPNDTLKQLLFYLEEKIKLLQDKRITKEELKKTDGDLRTATERRLQLAIEACIDIARHIIAAQNLGVVEHNRDALLLLGEKGVVPKKIVAKVASAAEMRNVLVHGYQKVSYQEIYKAVKEDLKDLKKFAEYVNNYIIKESE